MVEHTRTYMRGVNLRELHQSLKSARIGDTRILHAFKRQKTVFQCSLVMERKMLQMLDDLAAKEAKRKEKTVQTPGKLPNKSTQTDDERMTKYTKKCVSNFQKEREAKSEKIKEAT